MRFNKRVTGFWSFMVFFLIPARSGLSQSELSTYQALTYSLSSDSIAKLLAQADSCFKLKELVVSKQFYERARQKSEYLNSRKSWLEATIGIGNVLTAQGAYAGANALLEEALLFCNVKNQTEVYKAEILDRLSVNCGNLGFYSRAIKFRKQALEASKIFPSGKVTMQDCYLGLAMQYGVINMPEKSFQYLKIVDSILKVNYNPVVKIHTFWTYAYLHAKYKNYTRSKHYLTELLPVADSIKDMDVVFLCYWKLADIAIREGDISAAVRHVDKMPDIENMEPMYSNRKYSITGAIFLHQKQYAKAISAYQRELDITTESKLIPDMIIAHASLAKAHAGLNNYKQAYQHQKKAKVLADSFNREAQEKNIAALEAQYNDAQKSEDISRQKLKINKQKSAIVLRNVIICLTLIIALVLSVLLWSLKKNFRSKQRFKDEKLQLIIKEKELDEMRALMNGEEQERTRIARDIHDGLMIQFSTVKMNLSAVLNNQQEAKPYLQQLDKAIASLRSTAHNLMPDMLLDGGLAEAIYYFCENIKQHVAFDITFHLLSDIPRFEEKFELAVYRIVQELIQNVVKHAKATEAFIQIAYRSELLNITIEDDGVGINHKNLLENKGLGLVSIKNRLQTLNGSMEISGDEDDGTSIIIEFMVKEFCTTA